MADRTSIPTPDHLWNRPPGLVAVPVAGLKELQRDRDELAAALDEEHQAILMEYGRGPCVPGTCDICALLARVRGEAKK